MAATVRFLCNLFQIKSLFIFIFCISLISCRDVMKVELTGSIRRYQPSDRVFVSLSESWDVIYESPRRFSIDSSGSFVCEFSMGSSLKPVIFVRNDKKIGHLVFDHLQGSNPKVVDLVSGKQYPISVDIDNILRAKVVF